MIKMTKNDSIELVPYNPEWPKLAELEIKTLRELLPKNHILDIQHVGSTAIPGIHAKPIIDIQVAVDSLTAIKQTAIDLLKTLGYEYWYDNPDTERMFFVKGKPPFGDKRTHHVHIVEATSRHWNEKIQFRDYLLSHPEAAKKYEHLKIQLANQYAYDRETYTETKTQFIHDILRKAMTYKIDYEKNPSAADLQVLNDGIMKEHIIKKQMKPLAFFAYFIRNDQGRILGGCAGDNMYGGLFVGQLWVKEELRGKGYGTQLMSLAEELAKKSQCRFMTVNTFEWEALDFYKKRGFYVEFARHGFDKESVFYFLRKDLA